MGGRWSKPGHRGQEGPFARRLSRGRAFFRCVGVRSRVSSLRSRVPDTWHSRGQYHDYDDPQFHPFSETVTRVNPDICLLCLKNRVVVRLCSQDGRSVDIPAGPPKRRQRATSTAFCADLCPGFPWVFHSLRHQQYVVSIAEFECTAVLVTLGEGERPPRGLRFPSRELCGELR